MTNKKKTGVKKDKADSVKAATAKSSQPSTQATIPSVKPGIFSPGQFTFLILVSIGVSRIMQVRSAYGGGGGASGGSSSNSADGTEAEAAASDVTRAMTICVEHLGEAACADPHIQSLLKLKFNSALQLTALACSMAMACCWNSEKVLQQVNALFIVSPMATGLAALMYSSTISQAMEWRQTMICLVLAVLAAPRNGNYPFLGGRTNRVKSLASMALAGLTLSSLFRAAHFVMITTSKVPADDATVSATSSLFAISPLQYQQLLSTEMAVAAEPIVLFLGVDALTTALLYALAWYALPDRHQRTLLLLTAVMKLVEYFVELPSYGEDALLVTDTLQTTVLTIAFVAGVGWIAPPIAFKKKL